MTAQRFPALRHPIVQAPMAGGPSTPALAAAVSAAGGLGFLAAGYKPPEAVRDELTELTDRLAGGTPYGLNVFAPPGHGSGAAAVSAYAPSLTHEADRMGVSLGEPRWDDDRYREKLDLAIELSVPVVSFTFRCPSGEDIATLQHAGCSVWVTVTNLDEAQHSVDAGADALVVQGMEAGGHRGSFDPDEAGDLGLLPLLQLIGERLGDDVPLVATGGLATGRAVAAVLAGGAAAAQLGTAFMLCPEAGTSAAHREALVRGGAPTATTRAFTGRTARGIANRFLLEHSAGAPRAYPEVHHLTGPVRAAARDRGDTEALHLWAGQAYPLTAPVPAADLVVELSTSAQRALRGQLA